MVIVFALVLLPGCSMFAGPEAPESCGFPDGTALSYAGRSTTAALGVQEVVGDPLSHAPADIYITRDALDQGELRGRRVCAIFLGPAGFVEVTVHPADGGRFSEEPELSAPAPPDGISRDDAVDAARGVLPDAEGWEVLVVEAGPLGQVEPGWEAYEWAHDLSADLWVWRVFLARGDKGAQVMIDFVDGSVYGVTESILD